MEVSCDLPTDLWEKLNVPCGNTFTRSWYSDPLGKSKIL
jgi:hypothetical protein